MHDVVYNQSSLAPYLPLRTQIIELYVHMQDKFMHIISYCVVAPLYTHSSHAREGMEGPWKGVVDR